MHKIVLTIFGFCLFLPNTLWAQNANDSKPIKILCWATTTGPQTVWHDALEGIKITFDLFNKNGGLGGRKLELIELNLSESREDFLDELAKTLAAPDIAAVIGGPLEHSGPEVADLLRRLKKPWLGPWCNDKNMYQGHPSDPFAILPTWDQEINSLLTYLQTQKTQGHKINKIAMVYYHYGPNSEAADFAEKKAKKLGFVLVKKPISVDFIDWRYLSGLLQAEKADAFILWLPPGPVASLMSLLAQENTGQIYMTRSLSAPDRQLISLSQGAMAGLIFPAVVKPSVPDVYKTLILNNGPPGLKADYHSYLGLAQGQILVRAISEELKKGQLNIPQGFYDINGYATILMPFKAQPIDHLGENNFFLAKVLPNGLWDYLSPPTADKAEADPQ